MFSLLWRVWKSGFTSERIDLRRHDEVVAMKPMNFVRPECHRHSPPFGENCRMVTFSLGESTNAVCEPERIDKISRGKDTLKSLNPVTMHQRPVRDLRFQLLHLRVCDERGVAAACSTLLICESTHTHFQLDA
jgi:hypothetical protein